MRQMCKGSKHFKIMNRIKQESQKQLCLFGVVLCLMRGLSTAE